MVHYFFPAERNMWVEIVPSKDTDPRLTDYLMKFYEFIGKAPTLGEESLGFCGKHNF